MPLNFKTHLDSETVNSNSHFKQHIHVRNIKILVLILINYFWVCMYDVYTYIKTTAFIFPHIFSLCTFPVQHKCDKLIL
jgi:hypothetical protein